MTTLEETMFDGEVEDFGTPLTGEMLIIDGVEVPIVNLEDDTQVALTDDDFENEFDMDSSGNDLYEELDDSPFRFDRCGLDD